MQVLSLPCAHLHLQFRSVIAADEEGVQTIDSIEVTGSRILHEGAFLATYFSVTVITGDDLVNTGAVNIGEALNKLLAPVILFTVWPLHRYCGFKYS